MGGICGALTFSGVDISLQTISDSASYRGNLKEFTDTWETGQLKLGVQQPALQRGLHRTELLTRNHLTVAWYGFLYAEDTDTEVKRDTNPAETVLAVFAEKGTAALNELRGQFACAIWNAESRTLCLFIDPLGVKTLNFSQKNRDLVFASEASSLLAAIDHPSLSQKALGMWACNAYDQRISMWNEIKGLGPGSFLTCDRCEVNVQTYYRWQFNGYVYFKNPEDYAAYFRETFFKYVSDSIPENQSVASYLSGGMDSTSIAAAVSSVLKERGERLTTFTYRFNTLRACDEWPRAKEASLFMGATPLYVQAENYWLYRDRLGGVQKENPFLSWNTLDQEIFSRLSNLGIRSLLSGHGGDNLFTGAMVPYFLAAGIATRPIQYGRPFLQMTKAERLSITRALYRYLFSPVIPRPCKELARYLFKKTPRKPKWFNRGVYDQLGLRYILFRDHPNLALGPFEQKRREFAVCEHWGILRAVHYLERLAAPFDIEVLHPWLDTRVIDLALSVPPHIFHHKMTPKYFIRKAMEGYLPDQLLQYIQKPLLRSFYYYGCKKEEMFIRSHLENGWLEKNGWLSSGRCFKDMLDRYYAGGEESLAIFIFPLNLELWLKSFQKR
ncbi:MAG: hypothetical protein CSA81_07315 [Acidobacteria bacterium]|nr:MAG: hypothetical protein CSA81_07315 [Acidobacteriota bacterium]